MSNKYDPDAQQMLGCGLFIICVAIAYLIYRIALKQ